MKFKVIVEAFLPDDMDDTDGPKIQPEEVGTILQKIIDSHAGILESFQERFGSGPADMYAMIGFKVIDTTGGHCSSPCASESCGLKKENQT